MHTRNAACMWKVKLPFAGYSVVSFFEKRIVWDDPTSFARELRRGRRDKLAATRRRSAKAGPQAPSLPVVIGAGSHPFPFRTRKLSLLPPMVLCGKLHGRVGRCRHYLALRQGSGPIAKAVGPFFLRQCHAMKPVYRAAAVAAFLILTTRAPAFAQDAPAPPLQRWFELQTFTVYSRYRFVETSADVTTANQLQYKESLQGRINLDRAKRYTIQAGYFSGGSFISTWNNWGAGTGDFNGKDNYLKQLFASARPVDALELQYGG